MRDEYGDELGNSGLEYGKKSRIKDGAGPQLTEKVEKVNHPKHYNEHPTGIECIVIVEYMTFNVGNAVKYVWRAGLKPGEKTVEDLKKAVWYLKREIERLGGGKEF